MATAVGRGAPGDPLLDCLDAVADDTRGVGLVRPAYLTRPSGRAQRRELMQLPRHQPNCGTDGSRNPATGSG